MDKYFSGASSTTSTSDSKKSKLVPRIFLPLSKLESCSVCHKTSKKVRLRWCEYCAEVVYCSPECQQKDWKSHKRLCGKDKTDRIDIGSYWPFLAVLATLCRTINVASHPALTHAIINSPNPCNDYDPVLNPDGSIRLDPLQSSSSEPLDGSMPTIFPNGILAKPVVLGERLKEEDSLRVWWPTADSTVVRLKLYRRIVNEGNLVSLYLSICIAIMSVMYKTTVIPDSEDEDDYPIQFSGRRRVRLTYENTPISDFGIVSGRMHVYEKDRLGYWFSDTYREDTGTNQHYMMGQDPKDHHRMYIRTLSGAEWHLDFGVYTFNVSIMVEGEPYWPEEITFARQRHIPGVFFGKGFGKDGDVSTTNFEPRKRISILRNSKAHDVVEWKNDDYDTHLTNLFSLFEDVAGKVCTDYDEEVLISFMQDVIPIMQVNIQDRDYLKYPKKPTTTIDLDPGEECIIEKIAEKQRIWEQIQHKREKRHKNGKGLGNRYEKLI